MATAEQTSDIKRLASSRHSTATQSCADAPCPGHLSWWQGQVHTKGYILQTLSRLIDRRIWECTNAEVAIATAVLRTLVHVNCVWVRQLHQVDHLTAGGIKSALSIAMATVDPNGKFAQHSQPPNRISNAQAHVRDVACTTDAQGTFATSSTRWGALACRSRARHHDKAACCQGERCSIPAPVCPHRNPGIAPGSPQAAQRGGVHCRQLGLLTSTQTCKMVPSY